MPSLLLACRLAAALSPLSAEPFEAELEGLRAGLLSQVLSSDSVRRLGDGLTPAEVRRKVDQALAGSLPAEYVQAAFDDPRTGPIPGIEERFRKPPEQGGSYETYRRYFMTEERIASGAKFLVDNRELLDAVQRRYGVDPGLATALVGVETFYGRKAGTFGVFNALYTITMKVTSRSDWAAKELAAYLKLARREGWGIHSVVGSYAGAFGFGQFIPSSFDAYAVDFDGDGRRRYDEWPDVLGSVTHYISRHGYEPGGAYTQGSKNWWAIYSYNHSDFYVRVVIELRAAVLARAGQLAKRPQRPSAG